MSSLIAVDCEHSSFCSKIRGEERSRSIKRSWACDRNRGPQVAQSIIAVNRRFQKIIIFILHNETQNKNKGSQVLESNPKKNQPVYIFWEENDQLNHVLFSRQEGSGDENGA